jgi:uncharacterized Tic20 family protein
METTPPDLPPLPFEGVDKALAVLCHLSLFFGFAFILPLVVFLIRNKESPLVAAHAKEVLNFHISLIFYALLCVPLVFLLVGFPLLIVLGLGASVCAIIGAVRAAEGVIYQYPLTIRLI